MRKSFYVFAALLFFGASSGLFAQQTASAFFNKMSESYAKIKDYTAYISITAQNRSESGTLKYLTPGLMRIDFDSPREQALVVNRQSLLVYLPRYQMIMEQRLTGGTEAATAALGAGGMGLDVLKSNYSVSYVSGPDPVPLQADSGERVVKLRFVWRSNTEGFRSLIVSVDPVRYLIRRVEGSTSLFKTVRFDFTNVRLNTGLPNTDFTLQVEDTSSVNNYENFLFPADK